MSIIVTTNVLILYKCNQVMTRLNHSRHRRWRTTVGLKAILYAESTAFSAPTTVTCLIISLGYLCCWLPVLVFKILNLSYLPSNKSNAILKANSKNHSSQKCLLGSSSRSHGTNQFNAKSTSLQYHAAQETDPKAGGENSSR